MVNKFNGLFDNFLYGADADVRDYRHAAELYRRNNYRLAPKAKFLYHVVFNINDVALGSLGSSIFSKLNRREFNLLVETVDLPRYSVDYQELNQYNRKKLIQTKINFEPISMTFHDDMSGQTTLLWETYYRYYYQDPNYRVGTYTPKEYSETLYRSSELNKYRYGLDKRDKIQPFFNNIVVNQLYTESGIPKTTSFVLVNPIIIDAQHDTMDQKDTGFTKNIMRFAFESVMYDRTNSGYDNPAGFRDATHYDNSFGPLTIFDKFALIGNQITNDPFTNLTSGSGVNPFNLQQQQDQLPTGDSAIINNFVDNSNQPGNGL